MQNNKAKESAFVKKIKKIQHTNSQTSQQQQDLSYPNTQKIDTFKMPKTKQPLTVQNSKNNVTKIQLQPLSSKNFLTSNKEVKKQSPKSYSNIRQIESNTKQNIWSNTFEQNEEEAQFIPYKSVKSLAKSQIQQNNQEITNVEVNQLTQNLKLPITPEQALELFGTQLTTFEQSEIQDYKQIYYMGLESQKIQTTDNIENNYGFDDDKGFYISVARDHIAYRYELIEMLGIGSFAQVLRAYDHKLNQYVALKIIRNKKRFHQQALIELRLLENIKVKDQNQKYHAIHYEEFFLFRKHVVITFELLSMNLYELIRLNCYKGFPTTLIRRFALQMLQCLQFLRRLQIIHCDFKPENILLKCPSRSQVVIIDFGSSCLQNEKLYTYIQSRFYRAPEVILGYPEYDTQIDMWSLGCIIAELFTGKPLFPGDSEKEQLGCIMEIIGVPPTEYIQNSPKKKIFFDSNGLPRPVYNKKGKQRVVSSKTLQQAINCDDELLLDFIQKCIHYDPKIRLTPEQAIKHQWIFNYIDKDNLKKQKDPSLTTRESSKSLLRRRKHKQREMNSVRDSKKDL